MLFDWRAWRVVLSFVGAIFYIKKCMANEYIFTTRQRGNKSVRPSVCLSVCHVVVNFKFSTIEELQSCSLHQAKTLVSAYQKLFGNLGVYTQQGAKQGRVGNIIAIIYLRSIVGRSLQRYWYCCCKLCGLLTSLNAKILYLMETKAKQAQKVKFIHRNFSQSANADP